MTLKIVLLVCCLYFIAVAKTQQTQTPESFTAGAPGADTSIFHKVEIEASFPGGIPEWTRYLMKNLNAYVPVKNKAPLGKYMVIVRFIVAKDGSISNALAETAHGYGMEKEVLRIIKRGPKWIPASQDGRLVNAYRRQPVTFVVQGN